jgi:hypothetical protein
VRSEQGRGTRDALRAGALAALLSGAPSTLHALLTHADPLEASCAAGSILLPHEQRRGPLLLAATPLHLALSLGWALALARILPRRHALAASVPAGAAIAALDLGLIGRRFPRIRALPALPQLADHLAFTLIVATVLRHRAAAPH